MQKILLTVTNHFDLAWRRAFDRRIEDDGRTFVLGESYYTIHVWGKDDVGTVTVGGEELLPSRKTVEWVHSQEKREVVLAFQEDAMPYMEEWLERVDDPDPASLHPSCELNPNNTGVYVTRIKVKQTLRRQECELLGVEVLSTMAYLCGSAYPRWDFDEVWNEYLVTAFHDCVTATYVDEAQVEQEERWEKIDQKIGKLKERAVRILSDADGKTISVFNPTGAVAAGFVCVERPLEEPAICLKDDYGEIFTPLEVLTEGEKAVYKIWIPQIAAFGTKVYQ